jgi:pimeloyl-ACP methyl ester carboxylesterase
MIPAFLAKGFQAIAFDGPAHGRSDGKQTNPIEFANAMKAIIDIEKDIHGIIAHSFGGVASIYALSQGLPVTKLITIASPSIAEQVIANYRRTLNASEAAGRAFRNDLMKTHGITFEEISSLHLVKLIKTPLELFLIQDENDPEIAPDNAIELQKVHPSARVLFTKGLGHTRILRDEGVISACLDFLKS